MSLVHGKNYTEQEITTKTDPQIYENIVEARNSSIMVLTGRLKVEQQIYKFPERKTVCYNYNLEVINHNIQKLLI